MIGIKEIISSLGGNLFKGAKELIDEVVTSKEEKALLNLKLEEMTNKHLQTMSEDAAREVEAYLKDIQSARDRDVQANNSANASWLAKNITPLIAIVVIILSFGLFYYAFRATIPPESKDIVIYVLGVLSGALVSILSYYFGSTKMQTNNQLK